MKKTPIPSHLEIAHLAMGKALESSSIVIDATCGNGNDALYILKHFKPSTLYCFDVQKHAIDSTKSLFKESDLDLKNVHFINDCHSKLDEYIKESPSLIIYNLGYLPKSDKIIKTKKTTTLISIEKALLLIKPYGLISITCYPGHAEGKEEEDAIFNMIKNLSNDQWSIYSYKALYEKAPSLIFISKRKS